jgi:hypothetical protein
LHDDRSALWLDEERDKFATSATSKLPAGSDCAASDINRPDIKQLQHTARSRLLVNMRLLLLPTLVTFLAIVSKTAYVNAGKFLAAFYLQLFISVLSRSSSNWRDPHQ